MTPRLARLLGWAVLLVAALTLLILPANRYEWMREMDPTIPAGAIVDASGDAGVTAGIAAVAGVVAALALAVRSRSRARWLAVAAGLAVLLIWAIRFGG